MAVPKKIGRTRIKNYFTGDPNNPEMAEVSVDPRLDTGVPARIGSLAVRNLNDADSELYQKWGLLDTNWRLVGLGAGGNASIVCINFGIGDWVATDFDQNYKIEIVHGLNTDCLIFNIFEGNKFVQLQDFEIIDLNTIRMKVAKEPYDCRFTGKINLVS